MYLSVQKEEEAKLNSLFKGLRRGSLCALCAQNTVRGCWIKLFAAICVCMFKLVRCICLFRRRRMWGKGSLFRCLHVVCETLLYVCATNTACKYSVEFFRVLCLNALNSLEYLNWHGLKTRAIGLSVFLGWPRPVGWNHWGPTHSRGPL